MPLGGAGWQEQLAACLAPAWLFRYVRPDKVGCTLCTPQVPRHFCVALFSRQSEQGRGMFFLFPNYRPKETTQRTASINSTMALLFLKQKLFPTWCNGNQRSSPRDRYLKKNCSPSSDLSELGCPFFTNTRITNHHILRNRTPIATRLGQPRRLDC
jgi:hypothetical protein